MQSLFVLMFLLGFFALFVFLTLGVSAVKKQNGKAKRHFILTGAFIVMSCVGVFGIRLFSDSSSDVKTTQTVSAVSEPVTVNTQQNVNSSVPALFSMSTDEFKNEFNTIVGKYRLNDLGITQFKIEDAQKSNTKTFQYIFSDDLSMNGTLNPEDQVQQVMLLGTGGFSEQTGGTLMTAIATLIMTSNKDYTYNDAQDVIKDIGLLDSDINLNDFDGATVRNGYKYRFKIQDNNISTFGITAAK
ncbi:MAG TPA: hypothetical protein DEF35_08755 [Paenibacillus sp.]|nr:hypothetical protein [Paenibacillus sp.]OZQ64323.1 hypothetical protein CA599_22425 [Paenibacillus taichungensis]HBU81714.1 hypothetical protein [Paenibacillus sp.]